MILQALKEFYDRKASDPEAQMATEGFEWKELPFLIVIDNNGNFVHIEDTREGKGKKKRAKCFLVPQTVKRSSGIAANLLWDNPSYLLGLKTKKESKKDTTFEQHADFISRIRKLALEVQDKSLDPVIRFYDKKENIIDRIQADPLLPEIRESAPFISFRVSGNSHIVCEGNSIRKAIIRSTENNDIATHNVCLLTGNTSSILNLHPAIKGVRGTNTTGANIISFNLDAYNSYSKDKGMNAPVSEKATFAYTTGLNYLLGRNSKQKLQIGDATTVFWSENPTNLETQIVDIFGEPEKDDPGKGARAIGELYKSIETGAYTAHKGDNRFFVLGLSPNAARISVRFWNVCTIRELAGNIHHHFEDLKISHGDKMPEYPTLFRLLVNTASQGKADNIPPNIAGEFMRSILTGLPYPRTLLQAAILRNKAEQGPNYYRVSLIKGYLNRDNRYKNLNQKEELHMALDTSNMNVGYRLGRLFAVLEKIQAEAHPGINATIRDKYYASASGTPVTVFPILMRMKNHHIAKLENKGRAVNFERILGEIFSEIKDFPTHLTLDDQGRFAIGYYHQNQSFYTKTSKEGDAQ